MNENNSERVVNKGGRPRKGTLEWRGGTWCGRITITVDGESIRRWVRLETDNKVVARRKLARVLKEQNNDLAAVKVSAARGETYGDLATRVGACRKVEGIVDTESEDGRERKWIIPLIGQLLITAIRGEHVAGIYEEARLAGKSLSHLRHLRAIMRSRFDVAMAEDMIQSNPMARVKIPKAKIDRRERAVLTDTELAIYLAWTHPAKHRQLATLQRQTMSALARMFGGLRTGDIHALNWEHFDTSSTVDLAGVFSWGIALRKKTARPQRIAVPEALRPILRDWWTREGQPLSGPVFPLIRGEHAGEKRTIKLSHAEAMRRDLQAAFIAHRDETLAKNVPAQVVDAYCPAKDSARWKELFAETEFTRPVDFHSWRRAFTQAGAAAGISVQTMQSLTGHASLEAHSRYLLNTTRTLEIPSAVLPQAWTKPIVADSTIKNVFCAPGRIRTYDPRIRSPMLYPAELRAHGGSTAWRS